MIAAASVLVLAGVVGGLLAGLLGIGGGLVFVPALLWVVVLSGVAPGAEMHVAVGTSLAAIVLTSISSVRTHARLGSVDWALFRALLPGLLAGGLLGAALASRIPGDGLRLVFGLFLLLVAARLFRDDGRGAGRPPPGPGGLALAGTGIATLSTLLGIGGGTLTVPYLMWVRVAVIRAVGTAAAAGLPLSLAGATGFVIAGWSQPGNPAGSAGYVWLPAALTLGALAMAVAPYGARLAHRTDPARLRRMFACLLVVIAVAVARPWLM